MKIVKVYAICNRADNTDSPNRLVGSISILTPDRRPAVGFSVTAKVNFYSRAHESHAMKSGQATIRGAGYDMESAAVYKALKQAGIHNIVVTPGSLKHSFSEAGYILNLVAEE